MSQPAVLNQPTAQCLTDRATNANLPKARTFCVSIRICPHRMHVHFHAIQRSDRTIDDRFRQTEVDDESKEKFAEDRFNQLKNRQRSDRLSSQGKMAKPASD